ncbi:DUF7601 domain-containing protein [Secundilactobacillus muriivasis]
MVTKMLIQVISVVTLVFGTCYQSVQALASNTKRIEIQSARLIDKDNTAPATVKAGSEHELVVNLTINNKDGDHESGTTQLWVPEQQLTLLERKVTFEPETAADNARLVYEKLSNNQLQLSWQKVANTATFKVELPVRVNHAMTEMQLPIAVGSATDYLQPLTVLNEDATDDAVSEITGDPGLPGNILANLDQYLTAQQAQEEAEAAAAKQEADAAAQKEAEEQAKADAAAKAEAEAAEKKAAEKKAAEDKAKQEAEAKEQAEKDAAAKKEKEQQEADEGKETAKAKATLKARSAKATEESAKSKEKEADDKAETKGTDLGQKLRQAANDGIPESFFNTITLKNGNREQDVSANNSEINMDVYANEEFELIYSWDMDELKKKLGTTKIELGDFYTFKIYGLKELGSNGGGVIKSGNTELATYSYKNVTVDGKYDHQEVTITFDKAIALQTSAKFNLTIKQELIGGDPVIFEYNEEAIVTGVPDQVLNSIDKSGKFVGDQIEWTVTLKAELFSKPVTFDEITITDVLGSGHHYVTEDGQLSGWTITHGGKPVTDQFTATNSGVFKGKIATELEDDLVITFRTKPDDGVKETTFKNAVSAVVGKQKTKSIEAEASIFTTKKTSGTIVKDDAVDADLLYEWKLEVDLGNSIVSAESLKDLEILDTLTGNHKFDEDKLNLAVYSDKDQTGTNLKNYFKVTRMSDVQFKVTVDSDRVEELVSEIGSSKQLYFVYRTVQTKSDITNAENSAEVSINGMKAETGNQGTDGKGKLITKDGAYDETKTGAVVNWTLKVNQSGRKWSQLTVTDELPEYISKDDLSEIKIGNKTINIGEEVELEDGTMVKVTSGTTNDKGEFNEIKLTFENIKQAYDVKFTTTHAWNGGEAKKLTNKVKATTSEGYTETTDKTVTIKKRIAGNVFKDGKNQLANSIEAGKNHVQWRVGFGTRLDDNFSGKDGDINTVTIEETLNGGSHNYLSFPTKETDYRLYEIKSVGESDNSSVKGNEIDQKEYEVKLTPDQKDQNKMTIEITFTGSDKAYKQLMLVFATPIDLDAWFDEDADEPSEMKGYEFKNAAEVSYDGFKPVEVTGQTSLDKNGVYGSKNGTAVKDSREISWEAILNADGKRLTNVTITDKLSENHEYQNKEDIKLYTADVRHRVDDDKLMVEVVGKKAIDPADYTIEGDLDDPHTFLIKLKQPLTTALLIEYTTTRTSTSSQTYTNKVKLSSNEVLIEADAEETISASGEIWGFDARFKKIIGDDKDRPLGGATFKLQEKEYTAADDDPDAWRDATDIRGNAIGEITSPESGNFVIRDLKTYSDFRLIETASAEGYDHHIEPITFNKAAVEDSDWLETKYYVKNWPVTKRTALSISKEVTGLTNQSFEFKVSAKIDGKLDTSFNGTYPIAQSNETVTFENGIATFNLSKDQTIKITQLPVYLPGKDLEKRQYEIEEVKAETDNFETQVSVDNKKPVAGTTTGEIGLEDDGDKHTAVFFHNSLTTGNFILSKQVNEADGQTDPTAAFKFKIAATLDGQDYTSDENSFEAYRINANGNFGSKELVKFIDGQLMRVSDSDEVDVITLKANEQYMVKDLPEGLSLKVTELTPGHYHVTSQPAGQLDEGNYVTEAVVVPDKTVSLNTTITVANALPVGNLRLNKDVLNQKTGDDNLDFEFTLTIDGEDALRGQEFFEVTGLSKQDDVQFKYDEDQKQHLATLKLKHNDRATIVGLPKGVKVTITEKTHDGFSTTYQVNNGDQESQDEDGPTVTIPDGKAITVSYENARPVTGKLHIEKAGNNLPADQNFKFKIVALDDTKLTGTYEGVLKQRGDDEGTNHEVEFKAGEANTDLKAGQYLVIQDLPLGRYVVSEKATDGFAASWTVTAQDGSNSDETPATDDGYYQAKPATVTEKTTPQVVYTNSVVTGKLEVNKRVASHEEADLNAKYDFEITATKNADKVRNNSYEMIINNEQKTLSFSGDTAKLTLKHGETALVNGLPVGVELAVKEILDEDSELVATWLIGNEGTDYHELADDNVPEVTINDSKTSAVSYKNTRTPDGELMVKKTIEGSVKKNQSFKFNVQLTAEEMTHLSGEYQVRIYDQDELLTNDSVPVENDQITFNLQGGQWAVITGLPLAKYQVEEVDPEVAGMQTTWTINSSEEQTNDDRIATLTKPLTVNGRQVVAFTNLLETGKLQVNKYVASHLDKDLNATYTFDLQVEENDADRVNGNTYKVTSNDKQPDLTFEDGKAVLKIQGSGSVVVDGLPTGITVAVKERVEDDDLAASWLVGIDGDYEVLADDDYPEVEIQADKDGVVSYKNTRDPDGQLKVEKVIKGNIDADKQFNFAVRSTDDNAPLDKKYQVRTYDQNGNIVQTRDIEADSGDINIKLTGGHSAIISGLPLKTYQVHESRAGIAHMVTTWTLNHEGNATTGRTATLENALTEDGMQTVTFTNEVPEGDLRLEKIAEGTYSTTDKIEFTIQARGRLTGKYNGVLYQADSAKEIGKVSVEFNRRGRASVSLKPGQYLLISGLPTQRYQVTEERQADDVVTTWETDTQTGAGRRAAWVTTKENHTASVTFTNRIDVGSLTLNKWVASQHEDDLKAEYKFTLAASDDDIVKVADKEYEVKGHGETTHVKFDENGKAELTMTHDTPVTINGLPVGVELTVTETTIKDFVATWRVNNAGDYVELTDDAQPTITIDDTHTQVVSYKNTRDPEGQLQIEKQVTGAVADEDASYDFIIETLDTTTGETTPGDGDGDTTEQPTETEDGDGDATEQPVGDETSMDTETETPTPDAINLLNLNGSYSVLIYQSGTDKLLHKDTVEFDKGQATLALKADQYAVVNGLPLHTYQVREVDPEVTNMSTSWSVNGGKLTAGLQADAHELTADGVMTVLFNNVVNTGDLSIEKQVTGAVTEADEQQAYDFTVTAYREVVDGEVEVDTDYNQQHAATLTAANGAATTIRLDFKKGELAVSLKAGERLTIHNLDENRVVTVTETPLADFITTHRIGTEAVTAGNETHQITIGDDVTKHVTFINDKPATPEVAWLSLTKSVLGSAGETDRGFDFTVQLVDHLQQPITGIVKVVKTMATGTYVSGEMLFDDHGTATVTLQHNETVKLEVPNGAHYQIAETDYSADGYVTTTSQGGNPERTGLTVTGIAHQVDPSTALVVYYNRADTTDPDDELAHTDTEDDQAMPELVGPATDDGSGTTGMTDANPQAHTGTGGTGTSGSVTPQAYTSGSSKGILPQTGEFLRNHWVAVLGWLLLMVLIGMMVWRYRLNKE